MGAFAVRILSKYTAVEPAWQDIGLSLSSMAWRVTAPLRSMLHWIRQTGGSAPASAPPFCIILPLGAAADPRSVTAAWNQLGGQWRLHLVETDPLPDAVTRTVEAASADSRVIRQGGISPRLTLQDGVRHIMVAASGCILAKGALDRVAAEAAAYPDADLIYADEDWADAYWTDEDRADNASTDAEGRSRQPFLKPAWSIDLALEQDLVGGFCMFRRALFERLGALLAPNGRTVQDLALRVAVDAGRIRHIPAILSHRTGELPVGPSAATVEAVIAGWQHGPSRPRLIPSSYGHGRNRIRWDLRAPAPPVSVIIPTRDRAELLARCVEGVLHRTDYPTLELIIADNDSREPETLCLLAKLGRDPRVRVLPAPGPFNYSAINNAAAAAATGEVLVLLNNDIDVIGPGWLRELVGHAVRPDVGAVGARLLFGNGLIQHAGVVLGVGEFEGGPGIAGHFGFHAPATEEGHGGQFVLTREVSAVTGACMALRRSVFQQVGGLDEVGLAVALNDVDLCLRIRALGLRIIWTPFAELHHLESASRGSDQAPGAAERFRQECRTLRDRWGPVLDADPFYNPGFSRADHSFQLATPPPAATGL